MSITYILLDALGNVAQRGVCMSKEDIPVLPGYRHEIVPVNSDKTPNNATVQTHEDARRIAYPSVGDQLGAIWKAIAPLIEHPEAEAILAQIQAVKAANPKPSN